MATTYQEHKNKISIIQVAISLGYSFDRTRGLTQPSFVKRDQSGNELDRIYIKNPKNPSLQGYWRRNHFAGQKSSGDLISFIRENLCNFSISGRNEIDAINKILQSLSGIALDSEELMKQYADTHRIFEVKPFEINNYDRYKADMFSVKRIVHARGFSDNTINLFLPHLEMVRNKHSKYNYLNLAFPCRKVGEEAIVGYELRGVGGFKGAAVGSDRNALWVADFSGNSGFVKNVFFAESAYDIMALVQLQKDKINLTESVFVSTGGCFANEQVRNILQHYNTSTAIFCFDNDANGRMYDARAACLLYNKELKSSINGDQIKFVVEGKEFTFDTNFGIADFCREANIGRKQGDFLLWKAPNGYKDWNEVISAPKEQKVEEDNKYDRNINMKR